MSTQVTCTHCGAAMERDGVCPVCEFSANTHAESKSEGSEAHGTPRPPWWAGGRAETLTASVLFLLSFVVPLATVQRVHNLGGKVSITALQMVISDGPYGRELKSAVVLALPGAAMGLLSFLYSRRDREAMTATRPLVFVVSLLPLVAVIVPLARLERLLLFEYHAGPGILLTALGTLCGLVGAVRFGNGIETRAMLARHHDDDDEE